MNRTCLVSAVAAAAIACAPLAVSAAGIDMPARKPGHWEIKMTPKTAGAAPTMTMQLCLDATSDRAMMEQGLAMSTGCTTQQSKDGDKLVLDSVCTIGGRKSKTHTVISGDFQSSYTIDIVSDSEGGNPALPKHSEMTQNAAWMGACPAGMKPGDMMMPGGRVINILGALPKPGG